jgi:large subunit ribosomal protein L9
MPATIQVILQSDVHNVGKSGELVKVRPGFARNYLLPRALAVPATSAQVNRLNHERVVALAKAEKNKKEAQELAGKISALVVKIARPVGDEDRLFGSVTAKDIENAVHAAGLESFDRKKMHLADAIKALGTYELPVKLVGDVTATLKVEVVKK